ncbi:gluconate permease [Flavobacterium sp. ANB]|uniref:gluconate:H+ symporter n=1 Tax=unclassified Flavobacterium TaxID=196869 RepID=UPI0012B7539D|nr:MULTISPECIES: gluconate:H+ symporter [unclassified Flavobacterium]MBF4516671.1 gluconate permease [Flavobacterium sp. ANB]MTD69433.1 gluconate permease [Flavobacterium sp. LC2016-13]
MSLLILIAGILLLLILISAVKLNAFISLIIAAFFVGISKQMNFPDLINSIQQGIGSTLGSLILIIAFGVILGNLLSDSGAAQRISSVMIRSFGIRHIKWAMVITGFSVGISMFYNAGFIILIPMIFAVAKSTRQPIIYLGIAMASALSITHGFLPPHPGPTAIAVIFKADIGKTLLYGILVALPALFVAGIVFPEFIKKIKAFPPKGLFDSKTFTEAEMPSFAISILTALVPVFLMAAATFSELLLPETNTLRSVLLFIGNPTTSMLIAILFALLTLGIFRGRKMQDIMDKSGNALSSATMIILIIGAGGAFKQVLIDSGIGTDLSAFFESSSLSPLLLGWLIATIIRIALGSATVAGLTAAGIVQPLVIASGVSPELMVLSIGAGSLMCSHVNDTGFWMFKEYFGISVSDTFKTWTIMETIIGVMGLIGVLVLNLWIK